MKTKSDKAHYNPIRSYIIITKSFGAVVGRARIPSHHLNKDWNRYSIYSSIVHPKGSNNQRMIAILPQWQLQGPSSLIHHWSWNRSPFWETNFNSRSQRGDITKWENKNGDPQTVLLYKYIYIYDLSEWDATILFLQQIKRKKKNIKKILPYSPICCWKGWKFGNEQSTSPCDKDKVGTWLIKSPLSITLSDRKKQQSSCNVAMQ